MKKEHESTEHELRLYGRKVRDLQKYWLCMNKIA